MAMQGKYWYSPGLRERYSMKRQDIPPEGNVCRMEVEAMSPRAAGLTQQG